MALDDFKIELTVQASDRGMIGVANKDVTSSFGETLRCLGQPDLVFPSEDLRVVFNEAIVSMSHGVWRIEVDNIPSFCVLSSFFEIAPDKL